MERIPQTMDRVDGLDSLRFVCALVVFFYHEAVPPLLGKLDKTSHFNLLLIGLYKHLWNGPAAVIVFFVISGFCIHYPFAATDKRPRLAEFYTRRFLRLLLPAAVAIPLSKMFGVSLTLFKDSVLWSLLPELIYYVLYPVLRGLRLRSSSWKPLIIASYMAAFCLVLTDPRAGNYPSYGAALNWVLGLPCWLLGCALADSVRWKAATPASPMWIWLYRLGIVVIAWLCSLARFHTRVGYPWTLNIFALAATFWLFQEIAFRRVVPPPRWLEWAGLWSYSLYLMHPAAGALLFARNLPAVQDVWLHWLFFCIFVLGFCYLFYLLVERPSHIIARRASGAFRLVSAR